MLKSIWFYLFIAAVMGAGGWYFYSHQQITVNQTITPAPASSQPIVVPPNQSDEELNRKRQEGIGSIKNLKPVQIGPSLDKSNGK
jgi:hypothetical protein